jgi:hypothetical protein
MPIARNVIFNVVSVPHLPPLTAISTAPGKYFQAWTDRIRHEETEVGQAPGWSKTQYSYEETRHLDVTPPLMVRLIHPNG